jgi:hypothetical protein
VLDMGCTLKMSTGDVLQKIGDQTCRYGLGGPDHTKGGLYGSLSTVLGWNAEAQKFWREKGMPDILSDSWTKSVKCYAVQFGLGGEYAIEVWQEIENYAAFDRMDRSMIDNPEKSRQSWLIWKEGMEYFEWGPARLMSDWPESSGVPEE